MASKPYNCLTCGACCFNPPENQREGRVDYVLVEKGDSILKRKDLCAQYTAETADGVRHLRLAKDGRCLALRGSLGGHVNCRIYSQRPSPCKRVEAGSDLCRYYRRVHGLEA